MKLQNYIKDFALRPMRPARPTNEKLFQLGKELFMERKLSGNNNISCLDCHMPGSATSDLLPLALGEGAINKNGIRHQADGELLARSTPPLFNLGSDDFPSYFWDGRVRYAPLNKIYLIPEKDLNGSNPLRKDITDALQGGLAAQAIFPMVNYAEMRGKPGPNEIADAKTNTLAWDLIPKRISSDPHYKKEYRKY